MEKHDHWACSLDWIGVRYFAPKKSLFVDHSFIMSLRPKSVQGFPPPKSIVIKGKDTSVAFYRCEPSAEDNFNLRYFSNYTGFTLILESKSP